MNSRDEQNAARTEAQLIALARKRGYANPEWWAKKIIDSRKRKGGQRV